MLAVGYSMLGKKILHIAPPSIQCFNLGDTRKLVTTVAASEMTREYLIKQKILPVGIHSVEYDLNWRSSILSRELNYTTIS